MSNAILSCPHCHGILQVESSMSGLQVACPTCQGVVTVPHLTDPGYPSSDHQLPVEYSAPPAEYQPPAEFQQPAEYQQPYPGYAAAAMEPETSSLGCPVCGGIFQVTPAMSGLQVACPHCQNPVQVPELGSPAMAWPAGAPATAPDSHGAPASGEAVHGESPETASSTAGTPPSVKTKSRKSRSRQLPPAAPQVTPAAISTPATPSPSFSLPPIPSSPIPSSPTSAPLPLPTSSTASSQASSLVGPSASLPVSLPVPVSPTPLDAARPIVVPADPSHVDLHWEETKTVYRGGKKVEVRRLTPEEKEQRRRAKNVFMMVFSLIVLGIATIVLLNKK